MWLFIGTDRINLASIEGVRLNAIGSKKVELTTGTDVFRYDAESPEGQAVAFFFDTATDFHLTLKSLSQKGAWSLDLIEAKRHYDAETELAREANDARIAAWDASCQVRSGTFPHPDQEGEESGRSEREGQPCIAS